MNAAEWWRRFAGADPPGVVPFAHANELRAVTSRAMTLAGLVAIASCVGCVAVPERYLQPGRIYQPGIERLSVVGFYRGEVVETGQSGGALVAPNLGLYGAAGGTTGQYVQMTDASAFRWLLEETRCARVVDESPDGSLRLEGEASGESRAGFFLSVVGILEAFTLTPLLGVPFPDAADGTAIARLYDHGEFVKSYRATARYRYASTLYTVYSDAEKARGVVRTMALRELADDVAADLCGKQE